MKTIRIAGVIAILAMAASAVAAAPPNYKLLNRIKIPDGGFDYATFDPATNRVLLARSDFTTVIDPTTGALSQIVSAASGHIALPIPGTNNVLVTQGQAGMARIVDIKSDKVVADIPVGKNPDGVVYDSFSKHVFVMNHSSGESSEIDPATAKVVATIPVGGTLEFPASDGAGKVFVNVEDAGEIGVIDVKTHKAIAHYKMKDCESPTGLAYDAPSKLLIASCNGTAKFLRAGDGQEVASVAIGQGPDAVIYDAKRRLALIPCGRSGELDIIALADPAHLAVVQKVATQIGSRTGTLDPNTGRVYMVAAKFEAPPAPGKRPVVTPGSFEVLVVGP